MRMSKVSKNEYLGIVKNRYLNTQGKRGKSQLLSEAEEVTGMHRKALIRFFSAGINRLYKERPKRKRGRKSTYDYPAFKEALGALWLETDKMCSRNLKAGMHEWLPSFEKVSKKALSKQVKADLHRISAATMDRLLHPFRYKYGRGKSGTKPGTLLRTEIPIRAEAWDVAIPGYFEADTVAHCGGSLAGEFVWSLTITDIYSQWTEIRPVWHKASSEIINALKSIESELPFPIRAFDSDNGAEFINNHLIKYFQERDKIIYFTRSRPYKKNDQAHVEQKNWSYARQLLRYGRIDNKQILEPLFDICRTWSLLKNHFFPCSKLISKEKMNSRYHKKYDPPKTPYQRIMESAHIHQSKKDSLKQIHDSLDPCSLRRSINNKLQKLTLSVTLYCESSYRKLA